MTLKYPKEGLPFSIGRVVFFVVLKSEGVAGKAGVDESLLVEKVQEELVDELILTYTLHHAVPLLSQTAHHSEH